MKKATLCFILLVTGCATQVPTPDTQIRTSPEKVALTLDGEPLGMSPVAYKFDFSTQPQYTLTAKKNGYFTETTEITPTSVAGEPSQILVELLASPMWQATFVSPATNKWLRLIVNPEADESDIWQRMVDATTKRFPELDEFDYNSGYIKSAIKTKRYATPRGEFRLRSRFIAALADENPLTYKIKLISEWTDKGVEWYPYNRVFLEDALLIDELVDRFSMK
jgi:hypothetical protein